MPKAIHLSSDNTELESPGLLQSLESLVGAAQRGDPEAFASIVERFQDMAVGYAYSKLRNMGVAEEVAQESFLRAFLDLHTLREPQAFPAWFRKIVLVRCNRVARRRHLRTVGLEAAAAVASSDPSPEEVAETNRLRGAISEAIGALPEREATAVTLHYIGEYSYGEVANFLEIPVSTVKSRLYSARRRLRTPLLNILEKGLWDARPSRNQRFGGRVDNLVRKEMLVDLEGNTFTLVERTKPRHKEA